ncbi:MAG: ABC transporter ATP-binding protein [Planctomycetota bacterium]|nr:ABC transporter ATP-binding protein [Planctomycetota bacterium]
MSETPANPPALRCQGIAKNFGANRALDGAELAVPAGSIHALVGENGAGKSTLMNVVSGLLAPDAGRVEVFGKEERFGSPLEAVAAGIGMVHQHFMLAEAMTVAENVALGRRASPLGLRFDARRYEAEVERLSAETGLAVDPRARIEDLSVGLRQRVEILKALARGARMLLLDEPTAVLAPPEVRALFSTLERLRDAGRTITIITHKLDEVFALASSVTVLRRGKTVFAGSLEGLTPEDLARKMVGEAREVAAGELPVGGEILLDVKGLRADFSSGTGLHAAEFSLRAGEVLGVAGVEGNGQDELAGALAGTLAPSAGAQIRLLGRDLLPLGVRARSEAGIAFIPPDRHRDGLVLEFSLAENLILRDAFSPGRPCSRGPFLDRARIRASAAERLQAYGVHPPEPDLNAGALSGGNQQKVIIARELSRKPKVILACNPARGLDVGAAAAVHEKLLHAARGEGAGVLLISSDLDEVLRLSDRVAVLYKGTLREIGARGVTKDEVGRAMVGA